MLEILSGLSIDEQAPDWVLEKVKSESDYHAVLTKRVGSITPSDFIKNSRKFASLCDQIYQGTTGTLKVDEVIPVGPWESLLAGEEGSWPTHNGHLVDLNSFSLEGLEKMFREHRSVSLTLEPASSREDIRSSFAKIEWTRKLPGKLSFYAQQGGRCDIQGNLRPLEDILYKRMFFVPGTAPTLNSRVKLGVSAYLEEFAK